MMKRDTTEEVKTSRKNSMLRLVISIIALIVQVLFWFFVFNRFEFRWLNILFRVLSVLLCVSIASMHKTSVMKLPWIIVIMLFPLFGTLLYLIIGLSGSTNKMKKIYELVDSRLFPHLKNCGGDLDELEKEDKSVANIFRYIDNYGPYPAYFDSDVVFYADAAESLEAQKEALKKAKKFIFLEYHAIEESEAFEGVKEILVQKAAEGVDVRLFYDDMGSIHFVNLEFVKRMNDLGIKTYDFNPVSPLLNIFFNNRDHRKITVIDGEVAFTGGYNLADEYFNLTHPYGEWKDTSVKVTGNAVKSFTVMFLEMWGAAKMRRKDSLNFQDVDYYLPDQPPTGSLENCIAPYADSPLDNELVGQNVYMSIIDRANDYMWFTTPYLILSDEMVHTFRIAAKRGVDVRIITPGIPDKKMIYAVTRSYYTTLVEAGVKIYEYTPGFIHAKQCVSDDDIATCGTINLDFRSLYHHFEDGCLIYNCDAVFDIKSDFEEMFPLCEDVTEQYRTQKSEGVTGFIKHTGLLVLKLFSGML